MYTMDSHVRYSEADRFGRITPDSIVNYFQDVCMAHSESVGLGVCDASARQGVWLLSAWQIDIIRTPEVFENITVGTNPYEFKGFYGYRNFLIENDKKEALVKANSVWVYLDKEKFLPKRVPAEEAEAYSFGEPKLDMEYLPRKIKVPDNMKALEPVPVRASQLDTNNHVNNCEYIRTAIDVTGLEDMPSRLRAEYKSQAHMDDIFYPYVSKSDRLMVVDLRGEDNTSYAAIEFQF